MFTAENFRRIFDSENRKGINLAKRFFPSLEPHTRKVREKVAEIRALRPQKSAYKPEEFSALNDALRGDLKLLKSNKSKAINLEMEAASLKAMKPSFKLDLTRKPSPKGKPVFCIDGSPETFFVVKQLQYNIQKIYGVRQSNRHDLACQVRDTVASAFPFEVVRTDVSSFYETIDRGKLLNRLEGDQLLSSSSKKYIRQVLASYGSLTGEAMGIPRGVGISAYLAELYMRPIDRGIKQIPGLILYCRFVDDIAAVFARPHEGSPVGSYQDAIVKVLSDNGLTHNPQKTKEFALGDSHAHEFEYLGYRFLLSSGQCAVLPSASKIQKYETRINAAFREYEAQSPLNSRRAYRDLVSRIKFLTGNARLVNSKSSAVTGIYYNNSLVTDPSSFAQLDSILKFKVEGTRRKKLKKRLKQYKFTQGFSERRFHNFSAKQLHMIVRAWEHD